MDQPQANKFNKENDTCQYTRKCLYKQGHTLAKLKITNSISETFSGSGDNSNLVPMKTEWSCDHCSQLNESHDWSYDVVCGCGDLEEDLVCVSLKLFPLNFCFNLLDLATCNIFTWKSIRARHKLWLRTCLACIKPR